MFITALRTNRISFAAMAALVLLLVACAAPGAASTAVDDPPASGVAAKADLRLAHAPAAQDQSAPPVVIDTEPDDGARWAGGPVTLTFDQPLAAGSGDYLSVEPALDGATTVDGAQLIFTPSATPEPDTRYTFTVAGRARSAAGAALEQPVYLSVISSGPLQVSGTQPAGGAQEVAPETQIVVIFNRPVVPLVGVDDQAGLPQPLAIDPPLEGTGQWINTSVYAWQPTDGLAGGTTYQVTVDGLTGLSGETLAEPYTFSFSTSAPIVTEASPMGDQVAPDAVVRVGFSQSMDPDSTATAFRVVDTGAAPPAQVDGTLVWQNSGQTLIFTPTAALDFGASYAIEVSTEAQPASRQGNLRDPYASTFTVVPLPAVANTSPVDGERNVSPERAVVIQFNTPVSGTTVLPNVSVSPILTTTYVYSYYSEWSGELQISWWKDPQTTYTVTVGGDIVDNYGNRLGEDYIFHFTTGDYAPFTRLSLEQFTHYSAYTVTNVGLLYRNVESIDVSLYRLPLPEFFKLTGRDQWEAWRDYSVPNPAANLVWQRSYEPEVGFNHTGRQIVHLTGEDEQPLPPGIYLMEVQQPPQPEPVDPYASRNQAVIVLSNNDLVFKRSALSTSLAWLTGLVDGQPVPDRPVAFYQDGKLLAEATTGADGVAEVQLDIDPQESWVPAIAVSGQPGEDDFAVVSSDWNSGIGVWEFGLDGGYSMDEYQSHFYTERPLYGPGDTVYWKGIIRRMTDSGPQLPSSKLPIVVTVRDAMGNTLLTETYTPNSNGTLFDEFALSPDAPTGFYYLEARLLVGPDRELYAGLGFQVASYRKPEFEVTVTSSQPEYIQGDTVRYDVQASYFSGGPLANAPVTWRIISDPYSFYWQDAPEGRYYSFDPYDPEQTGYDPYGYGGYYGLIHEGSGVTGADGSFSVELPADLAYARQSQRWLFDVTIQSATNQFVSGQASTPIHVGEYTIGLSPQSYVVRAGQGSAVDIITITPAGEPYPGAELELVVSEYEWNSVYVQGADGRFRWETSVERTPVLTTSVTTDRQGQASLAWTPDRAGQYQVVATGQDDRGNPVGSALFVWVSAESAAGDDAFVPWPRDNNDRIQLVADKELYAPGDTAKILVPSPFTGPVQALITLEREGVIEHQVITLAGNSELLEIPITGQHIPNIYVGVILVKGIDETNPTPALRVGYVQLNVDTSEKALAIQVEPSASELRPGEVVSYTLTVLDSAGEPTPGAEVSVALVDKALLSMAEADGRTLLDIFYYRRPLGVSTGALLVINDDRMSQQLSEGAKGGGGGGDGGEITVREEFPDTAYWRADFVSDENGLIQFSVKLPDNLTTWRLTAKAVTEETLVGDAMDDIVATKELQVRPLLPRFFTAGDRAKIGAVIVNASERELDDGELAIELRGATLEGGAESATFELAPGAQTRVDFPIAVSNQVSQVVVTFAATAGDLSDAVRMTLPVARYSTPETVATAGTVPPGGVVEAIYVPDTATEQGELRVTVEPSLAAGMIDGLTYLRHYPYECNEQTVSSFLPNLFTMRALQELGLEDPELAVDLAYQLGVGVQRLVSRQNPDGGWGYWPGEESNPFITAYVLWGLANADAMGYDVPETTLRNAADYLDRSFQAPREVEPAWQLNQMAFMHFVLSELGMGDPGRASTLYDERERLAHYGRAYLAMALDNMKEDDDEDPRVETLLNDLFGAANLTATGAFWQEESQDWWTLNTDTRSTGIVLAAFVRLDPEQPLISQVVRWLMEARRNGRWATTQENAWSLIALTDWLDVTGELAGQYDWTVTLNDAELGGGAVTPDNVKQRVELRAAIVDLLRDQANLLTLDRTAGPGAMYYTTYLEYYLDALAIDARDRGIIVDRRFTVDGAPSSAAAVGDVISVTVTIVAPTDLYQLLIEVPIPAGVEPIDPSLATESVLYGGPVLEAVDEPYGYGWYFWQPTYTDIRDDKVALFASHLAAGTYEYTFQARATVPGEYRVLPVYGEQMYFPEVWGRSAGALFTVKE